MERRAYKADKATGDVTLSNGGIKFLAEAQSSQRKA